MKLITESSHLLKRVDALDALRGIAVLAMVFSGTIPFTGILPAWMYHAQLPPPTHKFNPQLAGLTWVDLVFPFFIFALGASIPLALSQKLERGTSNLNLILGIFKRGFFLTAFAIITQHLRPFTIDPNPGDRKWQLALVGFVILFLMFGQLPKYVPKVWQTIFTISGWTIGIIFLVYLKYPWDKNYQTFSLYRSDIILLVLANLVVFVPLIWLLTKKNVNWRLALLAILFGLLLSYQNDGWLTKFLKDSPITWWFNLEYLKYLFIAIPGTIAGDTILSLAERERKDDRFNEKILGAIAILLIGWNIILLVGLQGRWLVETLAISIVLGLSGYYLFNRTNSQVENIFKTFYIWGCYWLALGFAFEPYQGGIKKDSATMSYFFITTAISFFSLLFLIIVIDIFKHKKVFQLAIDNGQNAAIGYVAFGNLIWPIFELNGWQRQIEAMSTTPLMAILRGLMYTLLVAGIVSLFTRLKLFWKT